MLSNGTFGEPPLIMAAREGVLEVVRLCIQVLAPPINLCPSSASLNPLLTTVPGFRPQLAPLDPAPLPRCHPPSLSVSLLAARLIPPPMHTSRV